MAIDTEAEAPILWSPDVKSWLIRKDPDAGKDWRQEEQRMPEDKMVGWHHQINGHKFQQTLGMKEDREAWSASVHGVTKSWTRLSDWTAITKMAIKRKHTSLSNEIVYVKLLYASNTWETVQHKLMVPIHLPLISYLHR